MSETDDPRRPGDLHPTLRTRICELFGVDYPIVQTGMGFVAVPELTAATSNAGGLGVLTSGTLQFDELADAIAKTKELTDKPFGVNVRGDAPDVAERADLLIKQNIPVASFALAPKRETIDKLKNAGIVVIPSIGARRHAEKVAAWGVDAVLVQGGEGGGHTGSVPTSILLPQVVDAVDIPVVGAGGFRDGRGLVAALAYGAEGIAMGTRFLLTSDSPVPNNIKEVYLGKTVNDTVVTTAIDGVPQRVLRTELAETLISQHAIKRWQRSLQLSMAFQKSTKTPWKDIVKEGLSMKKNQELQWSQVLMAANTPMLLSAGLVQGDTTQGTLASGQVAGLIEDLPSCAELIQRIMAEADQTLRRLVSGAGPAAAGAGA
ncbi:MAG TPA: nitronate monooxygenase family protein [Acidimicrobiales bacterium]|nr:nitronate monooxygenase family protein [Acidimicrobiales bacterium]